VTTIIMRVSDRQNGMRGTLELPGGDSSTFSSDEELLDILYEWTTPPDRSGKASGSKSSSAIRDT